MTESTLSRTLSPFHLAFPVRDLKSTRDFYTNVLGCQEGRSSDQWIDFDLFGHQLVAHQMDEPSKDGSPDAGANAVDGHAVPVPHFGIVLPWEQWQAFAERLKAASIEFAIEPHVRFPGEVGEQATMFFRDPSGNALEFKAFRDPSQLFAKLSLIHI